MTELAELPLVSGVLDRDAATRLSEQKLDEAWVDQSAQVLRVREGLVPLRERADGSFELALISAQSIATERGKNHFYLGRGKGSALFAMELPVSEPVEEPGVQWKHPFQIGEFLQPVEQEAMAVAMALTNWHRSMPFSARDGQRTAAVQGGWAQHDSHGGEHFPRTDPAVIVLIEHDNRVLLGSNVLWETGRFSLLAGFVEAGESAEQAVAREVFEESGVRVENVRYVASQPWPFPRSLMLGFRATVSSDADPDALTPDVTEISELRWFTREELSRPGPGLKLPGRLSIARWLLDQWIAEGDGEHS